MDILNEKSVNVSPKDIEAFHRVDVSKNSSKKIIVCFIDRKHAKKSLISRKKLRKNSSLNCNVFITENLTMKSLFLEEKRSDHLNKIYTRDGTVHISNPEIHRLKY